ncbi:hypothetical protein VTJ04DRAFT_8617 [Mycothermus thermophilus]|uniref:uncharacterized protein n=1 Tax=Humicola insolens TaxID=85995 RepID=UPI00374346C8
MASRQLRKLRQQQELLGLQKDAGNASEESEDEPIVARPRGTMFSGFAALGDTGDNDDEDEDEQQQKSDVDDEPAPEVQTAAKKSKKKPKKKKKKAKQSTTPAPEPTAEERKSLDEIDQALEELRLQSQTQGKSATSSSASSETPNLNNLLRINLQHLKAMNEMRRVFGKAMDVAETEERTEQTRQRRRLPEQVDLETYLSARAANLGQGPPASKTMFDTILRTNPFIEGKKTWPRGTALGLKMVRVTQGQQQDEVEFAFAHDQNYAELEADFFGLVMMYDPMQIVHFLYRFPYHVSSLIQVSKVARQDQNSALAADLIERALFTFGRVSLNEFRKKLEKGQARLSFARPENRQFYLAGFNLIQKLVLKGTHRTALEWAKLFLSINHDDPYAMIHWIHVLAIRCREPKWFIDFCKSDLVTSNLNGALYTKQTLPLAYLQLNDPATAKSTLIQGMETLPWLFSSLFRALNLDTPRSVWGIVPRDPEEALYTDLYIHMAKDLWNTPNHIAFLREAAEVAKPPRDYESALPKCPQVSLAVARFIYLDNTPELMAKVPRLMLHTHEPNFDFDPLPPKEEENVFSNEMQKIPWKINSNSSVPSSSGASAAGGGGGAVGGVPMAEWLRQRIARLWAGPGAARRRGQQQQQGDEMMDLGDDEAMEWAQEQEAILEQLRAEGRLLDGEDLDPNAIRDFDFDRFLADNAAGANPDADSRDEQVLRRMPGAWGDWDEDGGDEEGREQGTGEERR